MQNPLQDFRYALRQLVKNPGFAATAIISLALGIGATTSVFSVVYGVLMNPYPYHDSERLVHLVLKDKDGREHWPGFSGPQLRRLRQAHSVESATGEDGWNLTTSDEDLPEDVSADYLTANAFQHFGVPPLLGRGFIASDGPDGQEPQPVVVLGYAFWQRHFGGDPKIVGHTMQMVHKTYTIVGVANSRFVWGDGDVYLVQKVTSDPNRYLSCNIRLKKGVTYAAATSEFQGLLQDFAKERPAQFPLHFKAHLKGLNDQFEERLGKTLILLLTAVALLLFIGCANVSILLLARGTAREHEFAVRAAVGASRVRIFVQLLTESLCLSGVGATLGVLLAYKTVSMIAAWLPEDSFPHEAAIQINLPVLLFCVGLALLTSILFGLSPAISLSRPELAQVIQANTRKATGGMKGKRMNNLLIAGQIAVTLVLMTAAGAAIGGFLNLMKTNLGYDPHNTMSVFIPVHENTLSTWSERAAYFEQLRARVGAMPEVVSAGISSNATPPDNGFETTFEKFGSPANEAQRARVNLISPEYFEVLHIPLLKGRQLDHAETMRGAAVAIVNQTFVNRYWPKGEAVGQQVRIAALKPNPPFNLTAAGSDGWLQIVGVVADARDDGLRHPVIPGIYLPYTMTMRMGTQILIRAKVAPLSILQQVRAQVQGVNHDQQVAGHARNLEQWIENLPEWAQQRLVAILFGAFAVLALLLASVGLYSVVSYTVAQRTNEIGIRMSLGARRNDVLRLVFKTTAFSVAAGLISGLLLSSFLGRFLQHWAEGSSGDPIILLLVTLMLLATAAAACFFPARRAASVDPMIALRCQ